MYLYYIVYLWTLYLTEGLNSPPISALNIVLSQMAKQSPLIRNWLASSDYIAIRISPNGVYLFWAKYSQNSLCKSSAGMCLISNLLYFHGQGNQRTFPLSMTGFRKVKLTGTRYTSIYNKPSENRRKRLTASITTTLSILLVNRFGSTPVASASGYHARGPVSGVWIYLLFTFLLSWI